MTQKSCAVGMRNAKLGNHLKFVLSCLVSCTAERDDACTLLKLASSVRALLKPHGDTCRGLDRVFRCCSVCETMKDYKERYLIVWTTIYHLAALLLGYTLRVLVTSYQLPWQRTRSTKVSFKFQFHGDLPFLFICSKVP